MQIGTALVAKGDTVRGCAAVYAINQKVAASMKWDVSKVWVIRRCLGGGRGNAGLLGRSDCDGLLVCRVCSRRCRADERVWVGCASFSLLL